MGYANRKIQQERVITRMEQTIADIEKLKREYETYASLPLVAQLAIECFARRNGGVSIMELEDMYREETGYIGDSFYEEQVAPAISAGHLLLITGQLRVVLSEDCLRIQDSLMRAIREAFVK